MKGFLTIDAAWQEFVAQQSDEYMKKVTGIDGDPKQLQTVKDLFYAGAQGALFALASIKEHVDSNGPAAVAYIMGLYDEVAKYARDAEQDEIERKEREAEKQKELAKAWPFPTGTKP